MADTLTAHGSRLTAHGSRLTAAVLSVPAVAWLPRLSFQLIGVQVKTRVDSVLTIRPETTRDAGEIANVIALAFEGDPRSDGREADIVNRMRDDSALTISLVAGIDNVVAGHIAFSKVGVNGQFCDWYGLAPVSVLPQYQNQGVGSALVNEGLARLKQMGAKGCVLLGEPDYYSRFGFQSDARLVLAGVPPEYFQALSFDGDTPCGTVEYHAAFGQCD